MNADSPSCSSASDNYAPLENEELNELRLTQGIIVWGAQQEILEEQALKELQLFGENLEEGEIVENTVEIVEKEYKSVDSFLDINSYIKRQEEFKKRQVYKKSLLVSDRSKTVADRICNQRKQTKAAKLRNLNKSQPEAVVKDKVDPDHPIKDVNVGLISRTVPANDSLENENNSNAADNSGSEYVPSDGEFNSDYEPGYSNNNPEGNDEILPSKKKKKINNQGIVVDKVKDDGSFDCYKSRLNLYYQKLEEENELKAISNEGEEDADNEIEHQALGGGLKVPLKIWSNLYSYQQEGVEWLWSIHQKPTGGLLGDEMGLGKTVQIIAFLHALEYSRIVSGRFIGLGPSLIVCPATVIHQWVKHFHDWSPEFRVAVLHQSGSFQGNKLNLIKEINKNRGIIVTTYLGILKYKGNLLDYHWHYIILDEGHKIRNPTAKVSVAVKQLHSPHRIMLTGSPMQNNLTELWSLFDFTNPGMLGNLNTFQEHFANPILHGGFANSTPMQEATALSVATTLKTVITPYLLRRSKNEVQHHISLPNKSEQVLFCSLTDEQRDLYKGYLMSEHVNTILGRGTKNWFSENHMRANVLVAITTLRKICNHPDLYLYEADEESGQSDANAPIEERFGYYKRSGKMIVVSALLKIWKKQGHRVLLFTQGRGMITVFQEFLEQHNYNYLKMDGSTSISSRQPLINKFNEDSSYDVFLLTTRVGGLGVNLTGANRVIIYDPDWNPATDTQARERAWRIGQEKQVTVYRLLSAGTIEEKMYQRQVWKQLLSNKVLLDPKTQRIFKSSDLHDLFSLQESSNTNPETANIFHDSRVKLQENLKIKKRKKRPTLDASDKESSKVEFSQDKIQAMKNLAQQIAKSMNKDDGKSNARKTGIRLELEEERRKKLKEKEDLKKLTPLELMQYNRLKAQQEAEEELNKIDDSETCISFSKALEYSERTSQLYHDLNTGKIKDVDAVIRSKSTESSNDEIASKRKYSGSEEEQCQQNKRKKHKRKSKHKHRTVVDTSGTVDGEEVEGLLKCEIKKKEKERKTQSNEAQDNYVLEKLFTKKGVSGALQHDSIVQCGVKTQSLRIHSEAKLRADRSLEALRKSRISNWRW